MYSRKTRDVYSVMGWYSGEWEEVCEEDNIREARKRLREYNKNEPQYPHRIKKRRVPIKEDEYVENTV